MYTSLQHSSQMEVVQPIIAQLLMSSQLHPYTYTQKLLTNLMPTDDERAMIAERRAAKPDIPLGPTVAIQTVTYMDPYTNPTADLIPIMLVSILSGHTKHPDSNNKLPHHFAMWW